MEAKMYDSKVDTLEHIKNVQAFINAVVRCLIDRAQFHDASKLEHPEKEIFDEWTPKLSGVTYGSDEYRNMLKQMKPAIDHHQQNNRHHPEFYGSAEILGMDLVDLIEMICDWKAATMRHNDGNIRRSLEINEKRFSISPQLMAVLENTVTNFGW
jgi:hypothetical protein